MSYKVVDKRGKEPEKEVCRVCGSTTVHSKDYNKPTMECINYLRSKIQSLEADIAKLTSV